MTLTEVSAPPSEAVPVRAFAEHLRLGSGFADDGSEDQVLELYLRAAMAAIEARTGRVLLQRSYIWTVPRWRREESQDLPIAPVTAIEAVKLVALDGSEDVLGPERWALALGGQRPRLVGAEGGRLPRIPRGGHAEVRLVAGYGPSWEDIPPDLRQAVFLLAAHYYENRAEVSQRSGVMPFGVLVLIEPYRALRLGGGA